MKTLVLAALLFSIATEQPTGSVVKRHGDYSVTYHLTRSRSSEPGIWWGSQNGSDRFDRFDVRYRSQKVFVPRTAIAALASVNEVRLVSSGRTATITIRGGDASEGYRSTLRLSGDRIVRASVENGEFPKNFREDTVYTNIPFTD